MGDHHNSDYMRIYHPPNVLNDRGELDNLPKTFSSLSTTQPTLLKGENDCAMKILPSTSLQKKLVVLVAIRI